MVSCLTITARNIDEYSEFIQQFERLSPEKQAEFIDILRSGEFDVKFSSLNTDVYGGLMHNTLKSKKLHHKNFQFDADFEIFGIKVLTLRVEGRFTHSGSKVKEIKKFDTYVVKCLIPMNYMEKNSSDSYVYDGRLYAKASYSSYFGINIKGTDIGAITKTFKIEYNCDGNGNEWGTGIVD